MSGGVVIGVDITKTQTASQGPEFALGTIAQVFANPSTGASDKRYKYVQYRGGAGVVVAVAGRVAGYYAPAGVSAGSDQVVTMDISDTALLGAGVLQAVIPELGYGWIQIAGKATLSVALASGADGNALSFLGAADTGTLTVAAAVTNAVVANAIDASASIIQCIFGE